MFCSKCAYIKKCTGIINFSQRSKLLKSYKDVFPNKYIGSLQGRYINTDIYKNYNLPKKFDILIYGSRNCMTERTTYQDQDYKKKWEKYHNKKLPSKYYFYPLRKKIEGKNDINTGSIKKYVGNKVNLELNDILRKSLEYSHNQFINN